MRISMFGTLLGAKRVDYETWQHVNLYVAVSVKNGDGKQSQKYQFKEGFHDYEKCKTLIGQTIEIEGDMETNDKGEQTVSVVSIKALTGSVKKLANA